MLFVQFTINNDLYIIEVKSIVEIIPVVHIEKILNTADYFPGIINFHGKIIPIVDLSFIYTKKKTDLFLSSRIIIVNINNYKNENKIVGILAENVTETYKYEESDFQETGIKTEETIYIKKIIINENRIIKWISLDDLIPNYIQDMIFNRT